MAKRRSKLILLKERIKLALAWQGAIFIVIKILEYVSSLGVIRRYACRLMFKGWIGQWF